MKTKYQLFWSSLSKQKQKRKQKQKQKQNKKTKTKLKLDLMKEINYIWMSISSKPKKKLYMNVKQYAKLDDGRMERTSLIVFIDEGNKNWPG